MIGGAREPAPLALRRRALAAFSDPAARGTVERLPPEIVDDIFSRVGAGLESDEIERHRGGIHPERRLLIETPSATAAQTHRELAEAIRLGALPSSFRRAAGGGDYVYRWPGGRIAGTLRVLEPGGDAEAHLATDMPRAVVDRLGEAFVQRRLWTGATASASRMRVRPVASPPRPEPRRFNRDAKALLTVHPESGESRCYYRAET